MNHRAIASALCGRYTPLGDAHGYLESKLTLPSDGALLGAYLLQPEAGQIVITDDGDTLFQIAVAGAEITKSRAAKYKEIAADYGIELSADGQLTVRCAEESAPVYLARFFEALHRIAFTSLAHRPKTSDRFETLVGEVLFKAYKKRVARNHKVLGASGHQLRFPFVLDAEAVRPVLVQTVASNEGRVDWSNVYQAGGKFRDVMNNDAVSARRVAVVEPAEEEQIKQARIALGDAADVILYRGPDELVEALNAVRAA